MIKIAVFNYHFFNYMNYYSPSVDNAVYYSPTYFPGNSNQDVESTNSMAQTVMIKDLLTESIILSCLFNYKQLKLKTKIRHTYVP